MKVKKILLRLLPPPFDMDAEERKRFNDQWAKEAENSDQSFGFGSGLLDVCYEHATGRDLIMTSVLYVVVALVVLFIGLTIWLGGA